MRASVMMVTDYYVTMNVASKSCTIGSLIKFIPLPNIHQLWKSLLFSTKLVFRVGDGPGYDDALVMNNGPLRKAQ